ncbi:alpha/beta hydrolase-fold protein [Novosphingobium sp.]|uniref:alpha/beta hydrolase n=1 Tax=Novosphingobium sp. TaxID=1874826 RepID=UPI00286AE624|nr:alpha/beta hydrolase-fold protein [Novosphingobium sp.]
MIARLFAGLATLLALTLASTACAKTDHGRLVEIEQVAVPGLPVQRLTIWLPPGYDRSKRRYGVVYMHDGHNLFDPAKSNFNKVWAADRAMLAAMRLGAEPRIIVGIWAPGNDRYRQYLPRDIYDAASPALRTQMDTMAGGPVVSDIYIAWLAGPLKSWVDKAYRTRPERDHTAIVGSSMGGLVSCYAFMRYQAVYGQAGCVSTHWPAVDPRDLAGANPELIALWDQWFKGRLGQPEGRRLWFDHGTATLDQYYAPYQQVVDTRIAALGWQRGRDWQSKVYAGAEHEENAWAARLPEIFRFLLR